MKKKTISLIMVLCMSFLAVVPASATYATVNGTDLAAMNVAKEMMAQYPLAERIEDAKSGKVDNDVEEDIREAVTFSVSSGQENMARTANTLTEDVATDIDYSIKNLGEVVVDGESVGTLYSATGTQKTKTGSDEMLGVEAYMSVVWIDNFGYDNVLVEVSGGWYEHGHYVHRKSLRYSATDYDGIGDERFIENVSDPFEYTNIDFHGLAITAVSYAEIWEDEPSSSGDPIRRQFTFSVSPTIFD